MTDYMAQMLDELMGPSRNALAGEQLISFEHRDVRYSLLFRQMVFRFAKATWLVSAQTSSSETQRLTWEFATW